MLPSENRLTKKHDFEKVRSEGKYQSSNNLSVSFLNRRDGGPARFGIIVSKKISTKAHERNKVKRNLREIVRKNLGRAKSGFDFVVIAKPSIIRASSDTITSELVRFIC